MIISTIAVSIISINILNIVASKQNKIIKKEVKKSPEKITQIIKKKQEAQKLEMQKKEVTLPMSNQEAELKYGKEIIDQLVGYVKEELSRGRTLNMIKDSLENSGYPTKIIELALQNERLKDKNIPKSQTPPSLIDIPGVKLKKSKTKLSFWMLTLIGIILTTLGIWIESWAFLIGGAGLILAAIAYSIIKNKSEKKESKTSIFDSLLFIIGLIVIVVGFIRQDVIFMIIGSLIMALSLYLLMSTKGITKEELEFAEQVKKEEHLVKELNKILAEKQTLHNEENKVRREIEGIYTKAKDISIKETELSKKIMLNNNDNSPSQGTNLQQKDNAKTQNSDVEEVLKAMDTLLEKLPPEEVERFSKSKDFEKYKKVMSRIK